MIQLDLPTLPPSFPLSYSLSISHSCSFSLASSLSLSVLPSTSQVTSLPPLETHICLVTPPDSPFHDASSPSLVAKANQDRQRSMPRNQLEATEKVAC